MAVSNNKPFDGLSHDEPLKGDRVKSYVDSFLDSSSAPVSLDQ